MVNKDLGMVTAYAYAVSKGYTGTEEEFAELMADYADVGERAEAAAEAAAASATAASGSAGDSAASQAAAATSAGAAQTSAQNASQSAQAAQADADAAALDASQALSAASTATTKAGEAAQSATGAAASATAANTAKTAAQTAKTAAETAQTAAETAQAAAEAAAQTLVIDPTLTQPNQAAEAKATGDAVSLVKSHLGALYPVKAALVSALNKNRFDGKTYEGQLTSTGSLVIVVHQQWVTTNLIYVGDLTSVTASAKNLSTGNQVDCGLFYLCTYDTYGNFIEQVGSIWTGKYTVASGVSYIRFSYRSDSYGEIQVESGSTKSEYIAYDYKALTKLAMHNDEALGIQLCDFSDNTSLVDITEDFTMFSGYIDKNNGNFVAYAGAETTDFINILEYVNLYVSGSPLYSSNCLYAVYDESKVFLGAYKQNTTEIDYHFSFSEIIETYPTAQFVKFSSITAGIRLAIKRPSTLAELLIGIDQKEWTGKKWICVGDSLTEVNSRTTKHYYDYVSEKTGVTVVNLGKSGRGYKNPDSVTGSNKTFYQVVSEVPTDADVVTIFGSGNDLTHGYTLGTVTDTGTETICGCINTTLDTLIGLIPTVQLGIVAPTPWVSFPPSTANNAMAQYVDALKTICENRSIPFLDLYHCSNLRPWTAEGRAACYSKDDGNGVHPDEEGHKLIAPRFKGFLDFLLV